MHNDEIIKRVNLIKSCIDNESVCDILIGLGFEAKPRKNFRIRHDERTASASIKANGYIRDYGGDFAGDIIDFLKEFADVSFFGALEYLESYFNINTTDFKREITIKPQTSTSKKRDDKPKYDLEKIKYENKRDLTPINALAGVQELYPFVKTVPEDVKDILGYSYYHNSLTIELDGVSTIRNSKKKIKWQTFGTKQYIPIDIKDEDEFVYIYSGMSEIIAMKEMKLSYIGLQSDSINFDNIMTDKTVVVLEENDDSSRELTKRIIKHFPFVKVIHLATFMGSNLKGYDLRDFVNHQESFVIAKAKLETISQLTPFYSNNKDEIVIKYEGKYIPKITLSEGVIVAKTGTGKTFQFQNKSNTLILVPRVMQSTVQSGVKTEELLDIIDKTGAMITYDKFYGHYKNSEDFRQKLNNIQIIVDEAHELLSNPSECKKTLYYLNALFISATMSEYFRPNLKRIKYLPANKTIIHFTQNKVPDIEGSLIFMDNTKALLNNYPENSILGASHNHKNVNPHTTTEPYTFSTSALREGVSINNPNFKASIVYAKECRFWSNKDIIQALHRVRGDDNLRILTKEPNSQNKKKIDIEEIKILLNNQLGTKEMNTIMGENYSKLINLTSKENQYEKYDEYGLSVYIAYLTRNNYDEDFYEFRPYEVEKELIINTTTEISFEKVGNELKYTAKDNTVFIVEESKKDKFEKWFKQYEVKFIKKLMKLNEVKNFKEIYNTSNVARKIREQYNQLDKGKYTIEKFYKLLRSLVNIQMFNKDGKEIKRVGSKTPLKDICLKVVGFCGFKGVRVI